MEVECQFSGLVTKAKVRPRTQTAKNNNLHCNFGKLKVIRSGIV